MKTSPTPTSSDQATGDRPAGIVDRGDFGHAGAESTFHHFADYNWDITTGAPSFVSEPAGTQIANRP